MEDIRIFYFRSNLDYLQIVIKNKNLKQKIASQYNIRNENILQNYLNSIVEIRNICAHGGVLFDHTLSKPLRKGPALQTNDKNKNNLYSVIQIILFILNNISQNRAQEMEKEIKSLFNEFKDDVIIRRIIEDCSGYRDF